MIKVLAIIKYNKKKIFQNENNITDIKFIDNNNDHSNNENISIAKINIQNKSNKYLNNDNIENKSIHILNNLLENGISNSEESIESNPSEKNIINNTDNSHNYINDNLFEKKYRIYNY